MADANTMQASNEKKAITTITKTKYRVLQDSLSTLLEDNDMPHMMDDILQIICDSLGFDPQKSSYDKEKIRQKCLETGKNTYEIFTQKYYAKNKELIDKKNVERTRKVRAMKKELEQNEPHLIL